MPRFLNIIKIIEIKTKFYILWIRSLISICICSQPIMPIWLVMFTSLIHQNHIAVWGRKPMNPWQEAAREKSNSLIDKRRRQETSRIWRLYYKPYTQMNFSTTICGNICTSVGKMLINWKHFTKRFTLWPNNTSR